MAQRLGVVTRQRDRPTLFARDGELDVQCYTWVLPGHPKTSRSPRAGVLAPPHLLSVVAL